MKILATSLGEVFVFGCLCLFVTILRCLLPVPPVFDLSKAVGVVYPSPAGARAKVKFLGKGSEPPPHQLGGLGQRSPRLWEHCKLPSGALAEIEFDAFLAENMAFGDYKMTDIFTAETCIYSCIYSTLASFA